MPDTPLSNITHVVVLMFENRSFDHILGAMPGVNGLFHGKGDLVVEYFNTMNPTEAPGPLNPITPPQAITPGEVESRVVSHDFNHDFSDGMLPDLFGPGTTGIIQGQPQNNPVPTYPGTNSGFLSTIAWNADSSGQTPNGPGAMSYFEWQSLKVLHTLASEFVVCDAWHCDMPGHTNPNRAFMHCATTGDMGIADDNAGMVNSLSIFESIQNQNLTWKMYWPGGVPPDTTFLNETVNSQQYDPQDPNQPNRTSVPIAHFYQDIGDGNLPFYSFIMCWHDAGPDTSMHPASRVEYGENFLASVYNALRNSPHWEDTLLIVNFDENGGIYDHMPAPQAAAPSFATPPPVSTYTSTNTGVTTSYDFTTLGVRTPVILVSPWLRPGIDQTPYQNTSILRFLQDMFPNQGSVPYHLTQRDLLAPSIAPVFSQFGSTTPRTDCPSAIDYHPGRLGDLSQPQPMTPEQLAAVPPLYLQHVTKEYLGGLPGHADSGRPITRTFASVGDMRAYVKERTEAAVAAYRAKTGKP